MISLRIPEFVLIISLEVDDIACLRNAKCYKNKETGQKTITFDRWGKITKEETD